MENIENIVAFVFLIAIIITLLVFYYLSNRKISNLEKVLNLRDASIRRLEFGKTDIINSHRREKTSLTSEIDSLKSEIANISLANKELSDKVSDSEFTILEKDKEIHTLKKELESIKNSKKRVLRAKKDLKEEIEKEVSKKSQKDTTKKVSKRKSSTQEPK